MAPTLVPEATPITTSCSASWWLGPTRICSVLGGFPDPLVSHCSAPPASPRMPRALRCPQLEFFPRTSWRTLLTGSASPMCPGCQECTSRLNSAVTRSIGLDSSWHPCSVETLRAVAKLCPSRRAYFTGVPQGAGPHFHVYPGATGPRKSRPAEPSGRNGQGLVFPAWGAGTLTDQPTALRAP